MIYSHHSELRNTAWESMISCFSLSRTCFPVKRMLLTSLRGTLSCCQLDLRIPLQFGQHPTIMPVFVFLLLLPLCLGLSPPHGMQQSRWNAAMTPRPASNLQNHGHRPSSTLRGNPRTQRQILPVLLPPPASIFEAQY